MQLKNYIKNNTLKIIAKPNSSKTQIISYDKNKEALKISINAIPDKGKANKELLKFLKKKLKKELDKKFSLQIVSGKTSKLKVVKIIL